jgi:hypothetical protein
VYAVFTLATIAVSGWAAASVAGGWAGVGAALALGTCESIWQYGGRLLLDPPLLLFATSAAAMVLVPKPRWRSAAALAALGVLVKGPFGIAPLTACVCARAAVDRSPKLLVRGTVAILGALVPAAAFLLADRFGAAGSWWNGYLRANVLASATGARADGVMHWWFPIVLVAGRFWPGLPGLLFSLARLRDLVVRRLAISSLLGVAMLCLPERKWGNHAYVMFPLLAITAGVAIAPLIERLVSTVRQSRMIVAFAALVVVCWTVCLLGFGRVVLQPPCVVSVEFKPYLQIRPPNSNIIVAAPMPPMLLIGELASERHLIPSVYQALPDSPGAPDQAIVQEGTDVRTAWHEIARARGWVLLSRDRSSSLNMP